MVDLAFWQDAVAGGEGKIKYHKAFAFLCLIYLPRCPPILFLLWLLGEKLLRVDGCSSVRWLRVAVGRIFLTRFVIIEIRLEYPTHCSLYSGGFVARLGCYQVVTS